MLGGGKPADSNGDACCICVNNSTKYNRGKKCLQCNKFCCLKCLETTFVGNGDKIAVSKFVCSNACFAEQAEKFDDAELVKKDRFFLVLLKLTKTEEHHDHRASDSSANNDSDFDIPKKKERANLSLKHRKAGKQDGCERPATPGNSKKGCNKGRLAKSPPKNMDKKGRKVVGHLSDTSSDDDADFHSVPSKKLKKNRSFRDSTITSPNSGSPSAHAETVKNSSEQQNVPLADGTKTRQRPSKPSKGMASDTISEDDADFCFTPSDNQQTDFSSKKSKTKAPFLGASFLPKEVRENPIFATTIKCFPTVTKRFPADTILDMKSKLRKSKHKGWHVGPGSKYIPIARAIIEEWNPYCTFHSGGARYWVEIDIFTIHYYCGKQTECGCRVELRVKGETGKFSVQFHKVHEKK